MSTNTIRKTEQLIAALAENGMLTTSQVEHHGVSREYLRRLLAAGKVERVTRGLYRLPNADISTLATVAEVSHKIPRGVICLLTALSIHNLTTQSPFEVWIAIENGQRTPRLNDFPVRYIEMSGQAFNEGIEHKMADNISVPVYSPAKTVADCFKFRNKIGLDVAIEALRDGLRQKSVTMDDLWHYSNICRVTNVIRPYVEAMQ